MDWRAREFNEHRSWYAEPVPTPPVPKDMRWYPLPNPTVPVPANTVALLRLPASITPLYQVTQKLSDMYGPNLVILTDTHLDGWMVIATLDEAGEPA